MTLRESPSFAPEQARLLNPLQLAYLGDTVWDLLVRSRLLWQGKNLHNMHRDSVARVNAKAQAEALARIHPMLTEEEADIARRGRNANAHHPLPKHQTPEDYQAATALEALMGYLYITGQDERLLCLFRAAQEEKEEPNA